MTGKVAVRIWTLIGVLSAAAFLLFVGPVASLPTAPPPIDLPWWPFAIAFAVTEHLVIHLYLRRDAHSLSLSELPLLLGYAFLSAPALLLARLAGAAFTLLLLRRQPLTKLVFNLALFALETVVGLMIFRSVLGGGEPLHGAIWVASGLAIIATDMLGSVAITAAIWLTEGRLKFSMLREVLTIGTFLALCNAAVGVLVLSVMWTDNDALLLPLISVSVVMYLGYRAHVSLRQRHTNLQMLYRFTSATARSGETRAAAAGMLEEVCELLRCDIAEFALVRPSGELVLRVRLRERELLVDDDLPAPSRAELAWLLDRARAGVLHFPGGTVSQHLSVYMRGVTLKDAVVAPITLDLAEELRGVVIAANRLGDVSTFDEEDAELFEALARHAGVALENGRLVERLREEAAEKTHQANHDSLTGLPNRKLLLHELSRLAVKDERLAVLLLDLDRFKEVNDTLGHATGDLLLQEVALRLKAAVRPGDTVARLGGDEFVIVVRNADSDAAFAVTERVAEQLTRPCALDGIAVDVRASIGIALAPDHGDGPDQLLQCADVAMYGAKSGGRAAQMYDRELDTFTHRRLKLAAELRTALNAGDLEVYYQPQVRLGDRAVVGAEALARWRHSELGRIGPDEFIPIAEETGLISDLTRHVLRRAIDDATTWERHGHPIHVSVNISARTVVDPDFPTQLAGVLADTRLPRGRLTLEVTESSMLTDRTRAVANLDAISDMGVKISIDDFGTGFSSMAYLKRLPLDEIKIDQGFVRSMRTDANDGVIVRSILDLAQNLGMATVAEGVEDEQTKDLLQTLGCDSAQGYLWSAPIAAHDFILWLQDWPTGSAPQTGADAVGLSRHQPA